jgi:penicillin-insensitive murein endopeptidase
MHEGLLALALGLGAAMTDAGAVDSAFSPGAPPAPNVPVVPPAVPPVAVMPAFPALWSAQLSPAPGRPRVIGGTSSGCLQGGVPVPASGRGYELLHLQRNRRFAHPTLLGFIKRLGATARKQRLGVVVIGDLSQARGGPTPTGHRSHQSGLDADIGYAAPPEVRPGRRLKPRDRERLAPPVVVDLSTHEMLPPWGPRAIRLLAAAASDREVDRIFVNPVIKRLLCQGPHARAPWQARVRPWWEHHDHFHVRLRCPADSPACQAQPAPPDDGCGATLDWWFTEDAQATRSRRKQGEQTQGPMMPAACAALLPPAK